MTEDHSLGNGDGSIDIRESLELFLFAVTQHIVLFDGVQCFLLSLQLDYVGIRHNALSKVPHRLFKCGREQQHLAVFRHLPLDAYTLVLVTLCGDHNVSLVEHKHLNFLGVYKPEFTAPIQHGPRCANNYLFLQCFISSES
uniref:Uncharacterized protein n=1 Tax=Amphilophus citrinellus TaxID=61819 RepID=A0A3Q0SB52_AMPCI